MDWNGRMDYGMDYGIKKIKKKNHFSYQYPTLLRITYYNLFIASSAFVLACIPCSLLKL